MFIKSEKQELIINLDRVCFIERNEDFIAGKKMFSINFYYDNDFNYWVYDSESARDKDFEKILILNTFINLENI